MSATSAKIDELEQLQKGKSDLIRLRGEVAMLRQQTNELEKLRGEIRQLRAESVRAEKTIDATTQTNAAAPLELHTRAYLMGTNVFVKNLQNSANAQAGESVLETLRRFLKENSIEFEPPSMLSWYETNGMVTARSTLANLDKLEDFLTKLGHGN